MLLLSDFDGVWTDPEAEARVQGELLERTLTGWATKGKRAAVAKWLVDARAAIRREPMRYGWAPGGRLSAFSDEDAFAGHSALLHYLHVRRDDDATARALIEASAAHGFETLEHLGMAMHARAVEQVMRERGPAILPAAAAAGHRMLAAGIEVVVVSNSSVEKLATWFAHAGLPATRHPERAPGALRLRGGARKFELDATGSDPLELGKVRLETARPSYGAVLAEERPDAVVGDVFSLDLSLPLVLKRRDPAWRRVRLFWLVYPHTPRWLAREVERSTAGEVEAIAGGLARVAAILTAGKGLATEERSATPARAPRRRAAARPASAARKPVPGRRRAPARRTASARRRAR